MRKFQHLVLSAALLVAAPVALAADSLDALLQEVKSVRATAEQQFQERAAEFNAASPDQQAQMLKAAQAKRESLASTADRLAQSFSANEVAITGSNKQMQEKARELGLSELFGLSRQAAGDAATIMEQSLLTAQFADDRIEFLRAFAASQKAPTAAELQRVWYEMSREMSASGQVAKFRTKVVQPGGESVDGEVIRIGPFTASSNGKFLAYLPELRTLNVYPRQPSEEFLAMLGGFEPASSGYVQAVVDSTRGVLMSLYVERPTFEERIELGEEVGYVIIAVGLAGALAFIFQLFHLVIVRMAVTKQLKDLNNLSPNNPLGRVLLAFKGDAAMIEQDADVAELRIAEAVLKETPRLERFQAFLRLGVAAGPLLGLIGTVVGMIITFQSITESGSSDPKLMATGIGQAMIATVLGLGIAIPLLFANALLNSLSRGVTQILDEQAVGMLAESIERQRRA